MEAVEVTARFDAKGKVTPINFVWQRRSYRVDSVGRQWDGKDGRHIMVMTPGNRAHHLLFVIETGNWYLVRGGNQPTIPIG